ncbi:MAG: biotin--[acetyl-CoA-carboxylase] ligase [Acidobacteriota bacterium]|nr:biotin--[acetyl-CoA-carboxylase] ligase [Acidobacteriota bacterium]
MRDRLDRLAELLTEQVENLVLLDVVDSTHAMARRLIAGMDEEDQSLAATVIIADQQECGEGRGDRSWESPAGGLYLSWMQSGIDSDTIAKLPMLAAAAALSAVNTVGIADARIKWPNDILVAGRKLAGMVVFARHGETNWATVGLGLNIATTPVLDDANGLQAVSLADVKPGDNPDTSRDTLISAFIGALTRSLTDPAPALASWRGNLLQQPGDTVRVRLASAKEVSGTLVAVSEEGFLRIGVNGDEQVITGGDLIES